MGCDVTITFSHCSYLALGDILTVVCVGEAYSQQVNLIGPVGLGDTFWEISAGALPDGLNFLGGVLPAGTPATISGTPTTSGSFTFTVHALTGEGCDLTRAYTVCAVEVQPVSFPAIVIGNPMAVQMLLVGCTLSPLEWSVASGALPDGLILDTSSGLISGIPTEALTNFEIDVTNPVDNNFICGRAYGPGPPCQPNDGYVGPYYLDLAALAAFNALGFSATGIYTWDFVICKYRDPGAGNTLFYDSSILPPFGPVWRMDFANSSIFLCTAAAPNNPLDATGTYGYNSGVGPPWILFAQITKTPP